MKKTLKILRRRSPEDKPYFESFVYEAEDEGATVATALMEISSRTDLMWEHSCLQKKCGACAMVINGRPVLACDTRLSDCKGETVVVEPLKKFPLVKDLLVDRSAVTERLNALRVYPVAVKDPEKTVSTLSEEDLGDIQIEEKPDKENDYELNTLVYIILRIRYQNGKRFKRWHQTHYTRVLNT